METRRKGAVVFPVEPWAVTETAFDPAENPVRETLFTLSNGFLGVRGALEEGLCNADSNPGVHLAGVYYRAPHGTEYAKGPSPFPKTLHAMATFADVLRVRPAVGDEALDLATSRVAAHRRTLNLKDGVLERAFAWTPRAGGHVKVTSCRWVPMQHRSLAVCRYEIEALDTTTLTLQCGIEKRVGTRERGADCWEPAASTHPAAQRVVLRSRLPASGFDVVGMTDIDCRVDGVVPGEGRFEQRDDASLLLYDMTLNPGQRLVLDLRAAVLSMRDGDAAELEAMGGACLAQAGGVDVLLAAHRRWWHAFWSRNDILIEGDDPIQQGVRFCLFEVAQSRRPGDEHISIGSNGLTGAMHGGLYFWDNEVYVMPPLLHWEPAVARELLTYRYHTLDHARSNARALRYCGAMYAWQTIMGEHVAGFYECTIGEQHINAAIPYGIDLYLDATGDDAFLWDGGAEVLVEQARFWADRVAWNARRRAYVINQITGPDEYTGFNNNNCYTNAMARWTLRYAADCINRLSAQDAERWSALAARVRWDPAEADAWRRIADGVVIPYDDALGIHAQDEAFLDLDPVDLADISEDDLPLEQHWPWERLMRAQLLKQPDVLLLEHLRFEAFSREQKRRDYAFYEPRTLHDSSLSPSIHAILAAETGNLDDAVYYLYRSCRLDLNNINRNTSAGIHLANCGGAWMAVVHGVAGLRFRDGIAAFRPALPRGWQRVAFGLLYRGRRLRVTLIPQRSMLELEDGDPLRVHVKGLPDTITTDQPLVVDNAT
jgi:trehalose/maltose hydrolase-like predicted phosphorylase